jgi:hypothetical protein
MALRLEEPEEILHVSLAPNPRMSVADSAPAGEPLKRRVEGVPIQRKCQKRNSEDQHLTLQSILFVCGDG